MSIELGDEVEDTITGFRGIVVSKFSYLAGVNRIYVQPRVDVSYILPEGQVFDESCLKVMKKNSKLEAV